MSLFFDVLSSINNPNQSGSVEQLASITRGLQQVSSQHGVSSSSMESVMSALGPVLGGALKTQGGGGAQLQDMIGQVASGAASGNPLQSLLTPQIQQQLAQAVAQKVGISGTTVQAMLPALLPIVMQLLNMGKSRSGVAGSNPLLNAFLGGSAGSTNLGHAMKFANRFLQPA
jgi:hypothetical protein